MLKLRYFYPRPPGGGRPCVRASLLMFIVISIHALRVEGDAYPGTKCVNKLYFYPRPPGGGRPVFVLTLPVKFRFLSTPSGWRATGFRPHLQNCNYNFYPRPPGGGRLITLSRSGFFIGFLSTPSGWRATAKRIVDTLVRKYFYPRPPGGGRPEKAAAEKAAAEFLSTPSGWRATAKTDKIFVCFCEKGRRICLFKTRKEKNLPVAF